MKKWLIILLLFLTSNMYSYGNESCNFDHYMKIADSYYDKVHSKEDMQTPQGKEYMRQGMVYSLKAMSCDANRIYNEVGASSNLATSMFILGNYQQCIDFRRKF